MRDHLEIRVHSLILKSTLSERDYYLGGLDDMSTWTSIVWRQAARALLNGTENCDIPHNTLGLSCSTDNQHNMDSVVEMMSEASKE